MKKHHLLATTALVLTLCGIAGERAAAQSAAVHAISHEISFNEAGDGRGALKKDVKAKRSGYAGAPPRLVNPDPTAVVMRGHHSVATRTKRALGDGARGEALATTTTRLDSTDVGARMLRTMRGSVPMARLGMRIR